ncbi:MAG TPA: hypothetical protein PK745_17545 [bacterium]|nr:hypothetical protein [bacterium]
MHYEIKHLGPAGNDQYVGNKILGSATLVVIREDGDNPKTESAFWYALKQRMNKDGHALIKKLMNKDGHLVSDGIYYLRSAKPTRSIFGLKRTFAIYDPDYQIRDISADFKHNGKVLLAVRTINWEN